MMKSRRIVVLMLKAYLIFCFLLKLVSVIWGNPYPWEVREGLGFQMGQYFARGTNPYIFNGEDGQPFANYMYGFLVPAVFAVLKILFGSYYILACQITTLLVEIAGVMMAYKCLRLSNVSEYISMLAVIGVYGGYWRYNAYGGAFPDTYGVTVSLFLCYLIQKDTKTRKFRPFVYALLIVVMFYIKQYFVVLAIGVFVYLLLKNIRDAVAYVVSGSFVGIASMVIVRLLMPTYFTSTVLLLKLFNSYSLWRAIKQFIYLAQYYAVFYVLFVLMLLVLVGRMSREELKTEKISNELSIMLLQTIIMGMFMLYFGQSDGTFYTYYLQLWIPYLVLSSAQMFSGYLYSDGADKRIVFLMDKEWMLILASIFVVVPLIRFTVVQPMSASDKQEWETVYSILDDYEKDSIRIKEGALAAYCVECGIYNETWGHDSVYSKEYLEILENKNYSKTLFPYAEELIRQFLDYQESSDAKMKRGEYDCILLNENLFYMYRDELDAYEEIYRTSLWAGGERANVVILAGIKD